MPPVPGPAGHMVLGGSWMRRFVLGSWGQTHPTFVSPLPQRSLPRSPGLGRQNQRPREPSPAEPHTHPSAPNLPSQTRPNERETTHRAAAKLGAFLFDTEIHTTAPVEVICTVTGKIQNKKRWLSKVFLLLKGREEVHSLAAANGAPDAPSDTDTSLHRGSNADIEGPTKPRSAPGNIPAEVRGCGSAETR